MAKPKRKFISEHAVNLYSARWMMFPADQITADGELSAEEAEVSKNCHIYLICTRPSLTFVKEDFQYSDGIISGSLSYRVEGKETKIPFTQPFPLLDGAVDVRLSPYPHREIHTFDKDGKQVRRLPAYVLSMKLHKRFEDIGNLKVLYVGQAFGGGNRSALDRLRSHSTLQKILADLHYKSPENEILVLTFEYAPYRVMTGMDGSDREAISDHRDTARFISIFERPLKLGQQVSLAEAALIRYFQPEYNKIYKTKFPTRSAKVLAECYELDFSALVVEIDTEDLDFTLHSDRVPLSTHHTANIDLVSHEKRASFFHLLDRGDFELPHLIKGA